MSKPGARIITKPNLLGVKKKPLDEIRKQEAEERRRIEAEERQRELEEQQRQEARRQEEERLRILKLKALQPDEDDDEEAYEDDFYEEDFEEEELNPPTPMIAKLAPRSSPSPGLPSPALRAASASPQPQPVVQEPVVLKSRKIIQPTRSQRLTIDDSRRRLQRGKDLSQLVLLDYRAFDLLEMAPMTEYSLYIRAFAGSNAAQASVQCPAADTITEFAVQTEPIEAVSKAAQCPDDQFFSVVDGDKKSSRVVGDDIRLGRFLHQVGAVIDALIEEDSLERASLAAARKQHTQRVESLSTTLNSTTFEELRGRPALDIVFCDAVPSLYLCAYGPDASNTNSLSSFSLVCLWSLHNTDRPQKVLISEGHATCVCFGPDSSSTVIAGTAEGSVVLWDLREDVKFHTDPLGGVEIPKEVLGNDGVVRHPTYCTDAIAGETHVVPVSALTVLSVTGEATGGSSSFQVASLDEQGTVNVYTVMELKKDYLHTDAGLSVAGRMKMSRSEAVSVEPGVFGLRAFDIQTLPTNRNELLVSADDGNVHRIARYGTASSPITFVRRDIPSSVAPATCLQFSPSNANIFLVGYGDGSIAQFSVDSPFPAQVWTDFTATGIVRVRWSPTKPSLFFVLDVLGVLHVFDLKRDPSFPIHAQIGSPDQATSFAISGSRHGIQSIAFATQDGTVDLMTLSAQYV